MVEGGGVIFFILFFYVIGLFVIGLGSVILSQGLSLYVSDIYFSYFFLSIGTTTIRSDKI